MQPRKKIVSAMINGNLRLTCALDFANEKQHKKDLREAIDFEGQVYQSPQPYHC